MQFLTHTHLYLQGADFAMSVQETVEPLMEQYKPPGLIKKIYFKNLSFGDAPFKVENVWVENEGEKHVLMEVCVRHLPLLWAQQLQTAANLAYWYCEHGIRCRAYIYASIIDYLMRCKHISPLVEHTRLC